MSAVPTPPATAAQSRAPVCSQALDALLDKLADPAVPEKENRNSPRRPISVRLRVIPCNESGEPAGQPFVALTRDLSAGGICLVHTRATNASHLLVVLRAQGLEPMQLVVEVLRCRAIGRFYEIAGRFVSRILGAPADEQGSKADAAPQK